MTLAHPDPLDKVVDRLIWRLEEAGWLGDKDGRGAYPKERDDIHRLLREELLRVKSDPWDDWV